VAYCTVADVQALRPQIVFTAGSKPSLADVQKVVNQLSDHINGIMAGLGVTVPLNAAASPIAYAYIHACVMWGAAGLLEDSQRAAISGNPGSQQVQNDYKEQYDGCITAITEKPGILIDAPMAETGAAARNISSFFTQNPTDDQDQGMRPRMRGTTAEPRFRMAQDF
jgi:hypothetical protein